MGIPVEDGIETVGRAEQAVHYILGVEYTPVDNFLVRVLKVITILLIISLDDFVSLEGKIRFLTRLSLAMPEALMCS